MTQTEMLWKLREAAEFAGKDTERAILALVDVVAELVEPGQETPEDGKP